jgi:hypothetical protein
MAEQPEKPKRTVRQKVEALAAGQQMQKIQAHFKEHKREYLIGGGAFVFGVLIARRPQTIAPVFNNIPAFNNMPVFSNSNTVNMSGPMRKIVRCVETDELWSSVGKAAKNAGVSLPMMSQHINGHTDHVQGLHYVIEGLATG